MARQDALSADLANATTAGYKADRVAQRSFGELMVTDRASGRQVGTQTAGARLSEQVTDLRPAALRDTGEPLDLGIAGDGWFAIRTGDGVRYTRNGAFRAAQDGTLVDGLGGTVLGQNGQPLRVSAQGTVDPAAVGVFQVPNARKVGDSYMQGNATGRAAGQVRTGSLEASGVDAARTVVSMLASLRAIEAGQKALTTLDESLQKANSVGNLRA